MYVHGGIVYVHGSIVYVHGSIMYVHGNIVYIPGSIMYVHGSIVYAHGSIVYVGYMLVPSCTYMILKKIFFVLALIRFRTLPYNNDYMPCYIMIIKGKTPIIQHIDVDVNLCLIFNP